MTFFVGVHIMHYALLREKVEQHFWPILALIPTVGSESHSEWKINQKSNQGAVQTLQHLNTAEGERRNENSKVTVSNVSSPTLCQVQQVWTRGNLCHDAKAAWPLQLSLPRMRLLCWHAYNSATSAWHTTACMHLRLQRAHTTWWQDDGSARQRAPQSIRQGVRH